MASDLVTFAENAVNVVDSKTLVQSVLENSFDLIERKNGARAYKANVRAQEKAIRAKYYKKAEKTYEKIWLKCQKTSPGHNWNNQDLKGNTHKVCTVCGLHFRDWDDKTKNKEAIELNSELIRMLQTKMIEKDEESGDLIWPV